MKIYKRMLELKKNPPKSELWFLSKWEKFEDECLNRKFGFYIPDVISFIHRYVIEIDGSIHKNYAQIAKDIKKNKYYKSKGMQVFRVNAYNEHSFKIAKENILRLRKCNEKTKSFIIKKQMIEFKNENTL